MLILEIFQISGKIYWSRQLFRKIDEPMQIFKSKNDLLKSNEAKRIVKNYNRMASALLEFELTYHKTWFKAVEIARSGMNSSLLIRHPESNNFILNFDTQIYELIDETKNFIKLELEIPDAARNMMLNEEVIKGWIICFQLCCKRSILNNILPIFDLFDHSLLILDIVDVFAFLCRITSE